MKRDASLAEELGHIRIAFEDALVRGSVAAEVSVQLRGRLLAAQRLAHALEMELDIYRREDDGRRSRIICEQLAGDVIGDLLEPETNVIRYDFGGRS